MTILLAWALALLMPLQSSPMQMLRDNPQRAGVNTHVYEFRDWKETPPPKGYRPVYVSHYGRHGSRTDWEARHYTYVIDILDRAEAAGILSRSGDSLRNEASRVREVHDGMNGRLTRHGEWEHRELARRLYRRYPSVFRKGSKQIRVECSTIPRCLVSMANFTGELIRQQADLSFTIDSGEKYFAYINNTCSPEHKAASKVLLDSLRLSTSNETDYLFERLFTDPAAGRSLVDDPDKLVKYIWYTARIAESSGLTENVFRFLKEDAIYRWWDWFNRELYIRHGNSVEFGAQRMERTRPLVEDMLGKAQEALETGNWAADLKFGHDYPLIAMAGFFHLDGIGERLTFDEIPSRWFDPMNIPLASNMQLVFYRHHRTGDVLVKFVFNDRERTISGLEAVDGVYYHWSDILSFLR